MIRVFEPHITNEDRAAVDEVLRSGWIGPGEKVEEFEELLCQSTGKKYAVCCNSGTTALMLAIEVLHRNAWRFCVRFRTPAYGMLAAQSVAQMLECEVSSHDFGMSPELHGRDLQVAINHNGIPGDVGRLEDACQSMGIPNAFGAPYCAVSFSPQKLVSAGQGGAVLTDDEEAAKFARSLSDPRGNQLPHGNFRLSDLGAALGVSQIKRLPQLVERRDQIHGWYRKRLDGLNCGWSVIHRSQRAEELIAHLRERGVEALQPYRDGVVPGFPNAEKAAREEVFLPGHQNLSEAQVDLICTAVKEFEDG